MKLRDFLKLLNDSELDLDSEIGLDHHGLFISDIRIRSESVNSKDLKNSKCPALNCNENYYGGKGEKTKVVVLR